MSDPSRTSPGGVARGSRRFGVAVAVVLALTTGACLESELTVEGGPTAVMILAADPLVSTVGDEVTFAFQAQAESLEMVVLDYGDDAADTVRAPAGSAQATGSVRHTYGAPGEYVAFGRAIGAGNIVAVDRVDILVRPAPIGLPASR